jgi:hypothetical protein
MTTFKTGAGFSIELNDWTLKRRGEHEGLPLYESIGGRISAVALVKEPAIEIAAIFNEEERTIMGPLMIPNLRIFRDVGPNGRRENCYWYFSVETIAQLMKTYDGKLKLGH